MGTKVFPLHPQDGRELDALCARLKQIRVDADLRSIEVSIIAGEHHDFVRRLESRAARGPAASTLQKWAGALYVRLCFEVDGVPALPVHDPVLLALQRQADVWGSGSDVAVRLLLVAQLRQWRMSQGRDIEHVAPLLGVSGEAARHWENKSKDPLMSRAMVYARLLGTQVRVSVVTREQWSQSQIVKPRAC
jgi:transcriptional regulator with XRE-family HTH domain